MNKSVVIGIVVAIFVLAGGAALVAHNRSKPKTTRSTTSTDSMANMDMSNSTDKSTSESTANDSAAPSTSSSVTIENFAFSPASITVKKGTTVTWTNNDTVTHNVTESDGQTGPDSGSLPNGKTYSFTFNTTGTFKYKCTIHPNMTGTVTVTE